MAAILGDNGEPVSWDVVAAKTAKADKRLKRAQKQLRALQQTWAELRFEIYPPSDTEAL